MGPQLLLEKLCLPCPSNQVQVTPHRQTHPPAPDVRLPIAQATVCFLLLFCKQGRCTDHTDPAAPHMQDPNQVLLHPSQRQGPPSSSAPSPRRPKLQALWGFWPSPPLSLLPESCCYFCHTLLLSAGTAGLKVQGGSVLQSTSPRGAGLPAMGILFVMNRQRGGEGASCRWSLGTWHSHTLALGAHVHVYINVTSVCDTCMCV